MAKARKAVILTADKFEDLEVFVPLFRLIEAGSRVEMAAPSMGQIGGERGCELKPTKTIAEVKPDDYDLL